MPADPLGGAVDHDVGAVLDRACERRGAKGVVHHQRDARRVCDGREGLEVGHVEPGIPDGLDVEEPGALIDCRAHLVEVVDVHELRPDAPLGEGVLEEVVGAAIERLRRDQVVAGAGQVEHREGLGRLPARHRQGRDAPLEFGHPLLEHIVGGVHDAGVDVPELAKAEEIGSVLGAVEDVARGGVDRHGARVGGRVDDLAGVDGESVRVVGHDGFLSQVEGRGSRTQKGPFHGNGPRSAGE